MTDLEVAPVDIMHIGTAPDGGLFRSAEGSRRRVAIRSCQALLVIVFLAGWEWVPQIPGLSKHSHVFDPFFISSPSRIATTLYGMATANSAYPALWVPLGRTVSAALIGVAIGMVLGAGCGLVLSNSAFWSAVINPFLNAFNSVPRVALVPVVIIIVGPTYSSDVIMTVLVVFFIAFFNAFEGGRTVSLPLIENARMLGAAPVQIMHRVRLPVVIAWTLVALPVSMSLGLLTAITAELFSGYPGMGALLYQASVTSNSSITFAVVVVLSLVGVLTIGCSEVVKRRVVHWWGKV